MNEIKVIFCLNKTLQFFKKFYSILLIYPIILLALYLPVFFIFKYHSLLVYLACKTPFIEILIYSFAFLEILAVIPFFTGIFFLLISTGKYLIDDIHLLSYKTRYKFSINLKKNFKIAFLLSLILILFLISLLGLQFLIYIIIYLLYYLFVVNNLDKIHTLLIFLLSTGFSFTTIAVIIYMVLPIFRKIFQQKKIYKIYTTIFKSIFSFRFIRNTYTYEYFYYWSVWFITIIIILGITYLLNNILDYLFLKKITISLIKDIIKTYLYMFSITIIIVYTSICSIFSKYRLEVPELLDEEDE